MRLTSDDVLVTVYVVGIWVKNNHQPYLGECGLLVGVEWSKVWVHGARHGGERVAVYICCLAHYGVRGVRGGSRRCYCVAVDTGSAAMVSRAISLPATEAEDPCDAGSPQEQFHPYQYVSVYHPVPVPMFAISDIVPSARDDLVHEQVPTYEPTPYWSPTQRYNRDTSGSLSTYFLPYLQVPANVGFYHAPRGFWPVSHEGQDQSPRRIRKQHKTKASAPHNPGPPIQKSTEAQGPLNSNLFIFHIPNNFSNQELHDLFEPFGDIVSVRIMINNASGRSRGFGFVSFSKPESATKAIEAMNGAIIRGKKLKVQLKREKKKGSVTE